MTLLAEIALLIVAAGIIIVCLTRLPASATTPWRRAAGTTVVRPQSFLEAERLVSMSQANALTVHAYLRAALVPIAAHRLAARGIVLERLDDGAARQLLGPQLWDLIRPGRPFPEDRHAPGIPIGELAAMLTVLEQL